jgi:predicted dehydrogenase
VDTPAPNGGTHRTAGTRPPETLRVGVIGGGLIAQVAHLPSLRALAGRFAITALADPSRAVREALGARYGIRSLHSDHRALLDRGDVDAVLVCSPNATHAEVALDALDAGLHVLVEKPLCLTPADADRIAARRDATGRVVQVGYMKRHEPAYEAMLADLAPGAAVVRHVATATVDPGLVRSIAPAGLVAASDLPARAGEELRRRTAEQAAEAIGAIDDDLAQAFSDVFLGALIHDVNAVHGILDGFGVTKRPVVVDATARGRELGTATVALAGGARWTMAWLCEPAAGAFGEELTVFATDGVRRLRFPAPYIRPSTAVCELTSTAGAQRWHTRTVSGYRDAYVAELEHFHACVTKGVACRTPVEQARRDIELLTELFACHVSQLTEVGA